MVRSLAHEPYGLRNKSAPARDPIFCAAPDHAGGPNNVEYLIGVILALAVAGLATPIGLDRGRAFYSTVLIDIASYYVLFAVMGASGRTLGMEIAVASGFSFIAILGFKRNFWLWLLAWPHTGYSTSSIICLSRIPRCHTGGLAFA
jgi:hypothetical protein